MNQPIKLRSCFTLATLVAMAWLLSGCLWPHTSPRSDEIRGRVLDAQTQLPIKGAKIYFLQSPHHPTYTDAKGYFRMKATRNFHWFVGADGSGYPNRKMTDMYISHEKYVTQGGRWGGDIGDILLKPTR